MTRNNILKDLNKKFANVIIELFDKSPHRVYIEIRPESISEVTSYIFKDLGARFNIASGVDSATHIEILYHFTIEEIDLLISLRVKLNKSSPKIDSLAPIIVATNWIEREMHELLGIDFIGHPNLKKLLLPDQWPKGLYPLRRDYKEWDKKAIRDRGIK